MLPLSGILSIDKAPDMTSHDVVAQVRRAFRPEKVKVGHAGTLDPDATGVLLVCIGAATRLADLLAEQGKTYQAQFTLGQSTTTEDSSGDVLAERDASHITHAQVEETLAALTGLIAQTPPMVSAVHHEGKRLYELARQGITVERVARTVQIDRIELLRFTPGSARPTGEIKVWCGKGTYIRTLSADLGERLGVYGHMSALRRLSVGEFRADDALPISSGLTRETIQLRMVPASDAVGFLPLRQLCGEEMDYVLHGRGIPAGEMSGEAHPSGWVRLVSDGGELIALAIENDAGSLLPKKVLAAQAIA